jgi:hypothetical protein
MNFVETSNFIPNPSFCFQIGITHTVCIATFDAGENNYIECDQPRGYPGKDSYGKNRKGNKSSRRSIQNPVKK